MPLPKETKIFGLTMANIRGEGKPDIVLFDKLENLSIISENGKTIWRGSRFGGTNNFYDTRKKKEDAYRPQESPPVRVYIPGRILIRDLDGDGVPEVIINRNEFSSGTHFRRVRTIGTGEIYNLIWEENGLTTNWKTREIKGYISDYQVKDADNDGDEELVAAVIESAGSDMLGDKGKSQILFFKLF